MLADKLFNITVEDRRKRPELTLPFSITYQHLDSWMPVLGRDTFVFWLQLFTFANRKDYEPDANIIDYSYKTLADKAGVSKYKITVMLRKLYEYGLLEIVEVDNRFGSKKQLYKVLTVPVYADTVYCQLKKCRSWEDRESFGQKQNECIKERKGAKSQSENQTGLNSGSQFNFQTGSQFKNQTGSQSENQSIYNNNNIINKNIIIQQQQRHAEAEVSGGISQERDVVVVGNASSFNFQKQQPGLSNEKPESDKLQQPRKNGNDFSGENENEREKLRLKILDEGKRLKIPVNDYIAEQLIKAGHGDVDRVLDAMKAAAQWARGKEHKGERINNWCGVLVKAVVDGRKPAVEDNRRQPGTKEQNQSYKRNIPKIDPETGMVIVNSS